MEKNKNSILAFYAVMSLVVILCSMPDVGLQNMGITLITIELIIAYLARMTWPKNESFEENHTTFVIRTIWVYTFLYTIGAMIASYGIWQHGNHDAIDTLADSINSGTIVSEDDMKVLADKYFNDNKSLALSLFRIWLCPAQLYLVWRILRGGGRAFKSYRIANPKS